jgi:hypothetical protein
MAIGLGQDLGQEDTVWNVNYPTGPSTIDMVPATQSTISPAWNVLAAGLNDASKILTARYAVPQLNQGQYIQTGPNGQSVMYQGSPSAAFQLPSISSLGSGSGLLLVGGLGLLLLLMFKK